MTNEVTIRRVRRRDEPAISRLWEALSEYHVALDDRMPVPAPGAAGRYAARLIERRNDPYTRAFVAEVGREVVGYVLGAVVDLHPDLFEHVESGYIADIYVAPAYRRRGIARQLFGAITGWFRQQGVQHIEWQVAAANPEGVAFWEAVGGRPIMVRMRLPLDGGRE